MAVFMQPTAVCPSHAALRLPADSLARLHRRARRALLTASCSGIRYYCAINGTPNPLFRRISDNILSQLKFIDITDTRAHKKTLWSAVVNMGAQNAAARRCRPIPALSAGEVNSLSLQTRDSLSQAERWRKHA